MLSKRLIPVATCALLACGCANTNPNILAESPYNKVKHVSSPRGMKKQTRVEVTLRGGEANVRNTIPALYKKALDAQGRSPASDRPLYVSQVDLKVFTKREPYRVSYQECKNERVFKQVPKQECGNKYDYSKRKSVYKCDTVYKHEYVNERNCKTKYKNEIRDVLYQTASADVYW